MASVDTALELKRAGRFAEALQTLTACHIPLKNRLATDVLRAELLEATGQSEAAQALALKCLATRHMTDGLRSLCEYVLGRVELILGNVEEGISHFQRSALRAQKAAELATEFEARLQIFNVIFERVGPAAAGSMLCELRTLATRLGDSHSMAKLHLFVATMEARRGLFGNGRRHIAVARSLLESSPNANLEVFAENLMLGICVSQSEVDAARLHGRRAAEGAERAGLALFFRASVGNLGSLCYSIGDCEGAAAYIQKALIQPPTRWLGPFEKALLEALARVRLAQGRLDECRDLLDRIDASARSEADRTWYVHREAELTRANLLTKQNRLGEAIAKIEASFAMAVAVGDELSAKKASLAKAELCQRDGRIHDAAAILADVTPTLIGDSPELFAHAEQILACALAGEGNVDAGRSHRDRAVRICESIQGATRLRAVNDHWANAIESSGASRPTHANDPVVIAQDAMRHAVHSFATIVAHVDRAEIVVRELLALINATGAAHTAAFTSQVGADTSVVSPSGPAGTAEQVFEMPGNGTVTRLAVRGKADVDSIATMTAMRMLLDAVRELRDGRAEREQRATLWPVEELVPGDDRSVVTGHMRELMTYAERIAKTDVNVLITGESGTGKEIVARAIHDFSNRSDKPFVPFNCTAIPRDLLESQLFGYRRGAFTGADRDYEGLIRTARTGTLFLDEVGELSLDLQPKLLRFLESGEIAPLGGTVPLKVDVRIVAATNTNLEDAVRAGRFREDLFYRLNVVRLSIRPLRERRDEIPAFVNSFVARAAQEFKKGHLTVAEETMERLLLYRWPGNVRQLQNEVRRLVALAEPNTTLLSKAISEDILGALPVFRREGVNGSEISVSVHDKLLPTLARVECEMIKAALRQHQGKVNAVAKTLGISRKGLYLKRQRFGL